MITILYFGRLAEATGTDRIGIDPPAGVRDTGALRTWLSETYPPLGDASVRVALNRELLFTEQPIQSGDEVAFLPPVSGG